VGPYRYRQMLIGAIDRMRVYGCVGVIGVKIIGDGWW
jgi:hypothetical protein